jgi:PAS domain S-box-containing protein
VEASLDRRFHQALDMLCIADPEGRFQRVNPAFTRVLGWSSEELLARSFADFVHPEDREATLHEMEKLAAGHAVIHFENRCPCKGGAWRVLSWTSLPRPDGMIYATARDVTTEQVERHFHEQTSLGWVPGWQPRISRVDVFIYLPAS